MANKPSPERSQPHRTPALDDPGRDGVGCGPGVGPGEGGRLLGRRGRPAAAGPDAGTPRRKPRTSRPVRRLDPRRPAHAREHRPVDADRPRVPMFEDHLARLAARPAIRFPRRSAGPDLGLQRGRGASPGITGLQFGMHNHWWEFEPVEGERPIRLLHESLHPDIFWQLDVYWAQTGGVDPAAVLSELMPRIGSLHWKDGPAVHGEPMTALGRGRVDIPRILRALAHPVDWVIELDECATDPLDAARREPRRISNHCETSLG